MTTGRGSITKQSVAPWAKHPDHPGQATVRRREVEAGSVAQVGQDHPIGLSALETNRPRLSCWTMCAWSRDASTARAGFAGLHAFDFGPDSSPVMDGFTPITPATHYSAGRGYGLKDARIGGHSTRSSPIPSTRTSSASKPAAWRSTYPMASTGSLSTSTAPRVTGVSSRPTAGAHSSLKAGPS